MCAVFGSVIVGAFLGGGACKISWRPLVRSGIREGLRTQHKLAEFAASIRTEAEQLVAEAREELDRHEHKSDSRLNSNL